MAEEKYIIPASPEYSADIRKLQDEDPASASTVFNPLIERLIENIHYLYRQQRKHAPVPGWSDRNILRNAYFIGGGSQQGGGKFPINQRGQTEYPGGGYTIDGWQADSNVHSVVLDASGLSFSLKPNTAGQIYQRIDGYIQSFLWGRVITLSALINGELFTSSQELPPSRPSCSTNYASISLPNDTEINYRIYAGESINSIVGVYGPNGISGLQALSLEPGDHCTAFSQDADGNWVLNGPPPDYALELAKCQRYLKQVLWDYYAVGFFNSSLTHIHIPVDFSDMRATPTIIEPEKINMGVICNGKQISLINGTDYNIGMSRSHIALALTTTGKEKCAGLNGHAAGIFGDGFSKSILASAEL